MAGTSVWVLLWEETLRMSHRVGAMDLTRWAEAQRLSSSKIGGAVRDGETRTCMICPAK